jgi:hypothetical protein
MKQAPQWSVPGFLPFYSILPAVFLFGNKAIGSFAAIHRA